MKIKITLDSGQKLTFKGKRINYHFDQGLLIIDCIDKWGSVSHSYSMIVDDVEKLNIISKGGSDEKES